MDFNSIPVRMQLWHGLLLVSVLAGLGYVSYQMAHVQKMGGVDRELQRHSLAVSKMVKVSG